MDNILEQINTSALKFLSPLTPEETYETIVSEALGLVKGDFGSIMLEENGQLKRVYGSNKLAYEVNNRRRGNTYHSFIDQKVLVVPIDQIGKSHPLLKKEKVKWTIFIPLVYEKKSIGVITLNSKSDQLLNDNELQLLKLFGSMAIMAIRKTQLYSETKNALETRDLFISLASHELRTPLTSINGYIQLLYSKLSKSDGSEGKWVKELYEESKRLTNLITELLQINRIKQGQLQFTLKECNVFEFLDEAIKRYSSVNPEKVITFNNVNCESLSLKIIGDCEKIIQMFVGLLNNADKFSPKKTPIEVEVKNTKLQAIIHIKDQGSGIARQDINKIFDGFYKGEQIDKGGLGVGLLLAKHIISYHHGSIQVKSKLKKGTIVEVRFPLMK